MQKRDLQEKGAGRIGGEEKGDYLCLLMLAKHASLLQPAKTGSGSAETSPASPPPALRPRRAQPQLLCAHAHTHVHRACERAAGPDQAHKRIAINLPSLADSDLIKPAIPDSLSAPREWWLRLLRPGQEEGENQSLLRDHRAT